MRAVTSTETATRLRPAADGRTDLLVRVRRRFDLLGGAGAAENAQRALESRSSLQREIELVLGRLDPAADQGHRRSA
jgi:hypothetical protein